MVAITCGKGSGLKAGIQAAAEDRVGEGNINGWVLSQTPATSADPRRQTAAGKSVLSSS